LLLTKTGKDFGGGVIDDNEEGNGPDNEKVK